MEVFFYQNRGMFSYWKGGRLPWASEKIIYHMSTHVQNADGYESKLIHLSSESVKVNSFQMAAFLTIMDSFPVNQQSVVLKDEK